MKKILLSSLCLLISVGVFAQAGLSQGQAVEQTTPNPTQGKKHCPHCGITMGNITYPWQHETWCPYYRSQGSSSGSSRSSGSVSSSVSATAMGVGAAVLGSALSSLVSSAFDHSSGDNNYYRNDGFAQQLTFKTQYHSDDDHTCVVLRDPKTGKKGIWHNAYVFAQKSSNPQPTSGYWILEPIYEQIYMDQYMNNPYAITYKEAGKGAGWKVLEFGLGTMCYKGHFSIISPFPATDVEFSLKSDKIMLQKEDASGKRVWGLYKVARAGADEIKKHPITLKELAAPQYDSIQFYAGQSIVWKDGHAGIIGDDGKEWVPVKYKDVGTITGRQKWTWAAADDGNCGLVNTKGEVILPFVHSNMHVDEFGVWAIRDGESKCFVLLPDGSCTPAMYDEVVFNKDGYVFAKDGLYGFASPKGETLVEPGFESIQIIDIEPELVNFSKVNQDYVGEKMLFVKKDGKWGAKHWKDGSYILEPLILDRSKVFSYLNSLKTTDYGMMARDQRAAYAATKDEFETEAQFEARKADPAANEAYVEKKMASYPLTFLKGQIAKAVGYSTGMTVNWHNYDVEKGAFPFTSNLSPIPIYYLPVSIEEGPAFREALASVRTKDLLQTVTVFLYQGFAQIASMDVVLPSGKTYHYENPGLKGYTGPIVKYSDLY